MKTRLLIYSIFMLSLFFLIGCNTNNVNYQVTNTTPTGAKEIYKTHSSKNNTQYKMKSIQNHTIHVRELSNGFYIPEFRGKIVLLRVFTKESLHNPKELPMVHHLFSKYRNYMGVLAIHAGHKMSPKTAINLIKKYKMNYPIVEHVSASELVYTLRHDYNWGGQSSLTLLIKNGITEYTIAGSINYGNLERKIQTLL